MTNRVTMRTSRANCFEVGAPPVPKGLRHPNHVKVRLIRTTSQFTTPELALELKCGRRLQDLIEHRVKTDMCRSLLAPI